MCGRTSLSLNKEQIQCACSYIQRNENQYTKPDWLPEHNEGIEYIPSHNIAPTSVTPVLLSSSKFKNTTSCDRVLKPMMWGLIPPWHKGDYKTHNLSTNNCRLESIQSSKLFGPILKNGGRCIIFVEGFYEWQTTNKSAKVKQPYYIYAPQDNEVKIDEPHTRNNSFDNEIGWKGVRLLQLAGLYNTWHNGNTIIYSYSIITMDSNSTLDWLHHRMPAILDTQEQTLAWLDIDSVDPDMALSYLRPTKLLSWHPVSSAVNNSRNKSYDCNKRVNVEKKNNSQKTLNMWFTRKEKRKLGDETNPDCKKIKM